MMTKVSRYLLIMQARETVELGMLKAKVAALTCPPFQKPLSAVHF